MGLMQGWEPRPKRTRLASLELGIRTTIMGKNGRFRSTSGDGGDRSLAHSDRSRWMLDGCHCFSRCIRTLFCAKIVTRLTAIVHIYCVEIAELYGNPFPLDLIGVALATARLRTDTLWWLSGSEHRLRVSSSVSPVVMNYFSY